MALEWNTDNTVSIRPIPKRMRKVTGTRFAAILGENRWATPFQQWCEITGAYRMPFEDTIYTLAGKAIEPIQIEYVREEYDLPDLIDPTMEYGPDPFKKTFGHFFDEPVLGGMWDAIHRDENGDVDLVVECKTTKRAEDWEDDVPEYYALQAALYAYLLGCDDVMMVVSFLQDSDYENPDSFVCTDDNTAVIEFSLSERYPYFENDYVNVVIDWFDDYCKTGDSPEYDEKLDADYLKEMRNTAINPTSDVDSLLDELAELNHEVAIVEGTIKDKQKRIKNLKDQLKKLAQERIGDNKTATIKNDDVTCTLSRSTSTVVDEGAMKEAGIWEDYTTEKVSERFTVKFSK